MIAQQTVRNFEASDIAPKLQSSLRKRHCTETVLLSHILYDVCDAIDCVTLLALLDVRTAFDTVDR